MNTSIGKITVGMEEFRDIGKQNQYQLTFKVENHAQLYVTFFSNENDIQSVPETCEILKRMRFLIDCGVLEKGEKRHLFAFHRLPIGHSLKHWTQELKGQMDPKDLIQHIKAFNNLIESLKNQGIAIKSLNGCTRLEECEIEHGRDMVRFFWNEEKKTIDAFLYPTLSLTMQKQDSLVSIVPLTLFKNYWNLIELNVYMKNYSFDPKLRLKLQQGLPYRKSKLYIDTLHENSLNFWTFTVAHDPTLLIKISKWKPDFEPLKSLIHPEAAVSKWKKQGRILSTLYLFGYKIYVLNKVG
jgi:hypothetical protein